MLDMVGVESRRDGAHGGLEDILPWTWGVVHCCRGSIVVEGLMCVLSWRVVDFVGVVVRWV